MAFGFLGLFALVLVSAIGLHIYFESNKTKIIAKINNQINENIQGEVKISDISYQFLRSFPNFTLVVNQVEIRDNSWQFHKRSLLKAKEIELRLNLLMLLQNEVRFHKMVIHDATIDMFRDKNGNSNSDIFKPKKIKSTSTTTTSIGEIDFQNVIFISENQKGKKLFRFEMESLKGKIDHSTGDWKTNMQLRVRAKSMAFNQERGSFIKDQLVQGNLAIDFSEAGNKISVLAENLNIGNDLFRIKAHFNLDSTNALFDIDIRTKILWKNASNLLANNISSKLNRFDLQMPLQASCTIKGDMNAAGDPEIVVNAVVQNDELTTSYGLVKKCSFKGKYTNNFKTGQPFTDANSAVIIEHFKGKWNEIPMAVPLMIISNFDQPIARGKLNSKFDVVKLKNLIDEDFIQFSAGTAKVNLNFEVAIVDLKLNKPRFTGAINIQKANVYFHSKNALLEQTDIDLYFIEQALWIKKIKFKNQKSSVSMEGRVDNFLNLYYDAPEKMVVNWKVRSPYLDVKQIIGILSHHDTSAPNKSETKSQSINQLQEVFDKSRVAIDLQVDKMAFNKMIANQLKVEVSLINGGLYVKKGTMQGDTGSSITFDAQLVPKNDRMLFRSNVNVKETLISNFLASFDNFGVQSFKPKDIKGRLSFRAKLSGALDSKKDLDQKSLAGNFNFQIKKGALVNFEPIQKIGKFAFPNRNVSHIRFSVLEGFTAIKGDKIEVKDFKVTSNVLNMDVKGVYSLSNQGTNLGLRIPLRNPKDDYKVVNKRERDSLRYRGIILSLLVVDDEDGKTKIKLGKLDEELDTQ